MGMGWGWLTGGGVGLNGDFVEFFNLLCGGGGGGTGRKNMERFEGWMGF